MNTTTRPVRAALGLAGLATMTALLVGCGDNAGEGDDTSGAPAPAASETPTETAEPTDPALELGAPLDTRGLELGDAPGIAWLQGRTLHTPGGDVEMPADFYQVVRYDDGWLGLASADDDGYVGVRMTADGEIIDQVSTGDRIATSADGSQVLWIDGNALTIHDNETGADIAITEDKGGLEPVAVENGTAYFNVKVDGTWQKDGRWSKDGTIHDPVPGDPQPYNGASVDGMTTQFSSLDDFGSCSEVRSPHGNSLGETCDFTLDEFSPDGAHLLAGPAYRDGFGDGELAVLPAVDGGITKDAAILHFGRDGDADPFYLKSVWEDETHFLVMTFTPEPGSAKGTWQIVRVGLDGTVEDAVEPVKANDLASPFSLA
jgi:hypothetical protein